MRPSSIAALASILAMLGSAGLPAQQPAAAPHAPDPTFEKWCSHCHRSGLYMAGTLGLQRKYNGSKPALLEERDDLTVEAVKAFVRHGSNSMPPFRKTEISDAELDALARYLAKQ
jgi:mono/diheme cytochrome c family protein